MKVAGGAAEIPVDDVDDTNGGNSMSITRLTSRGRTGRPDGIVLATVDSHATALALAGATPGAVSVVPDAGHGWVVVRRPGPSPR